MTETPSYESSAASRRRVMVAVGVLAAVVAMAGGTYALWTLDVSASPDELGANETVNASVADAPEPVTSRTGDALFVLRHEGGSPVRYGNLRVVVYDDGVPVLTFTDDRWRRGGIAVLENGTRPSVGGRFAPGDGVVVTERPHENAARLQDDDAYVVALVDAESGRTLVRDRVALE